MIAADTCVTCPLCGTRYAEPSGRICHAGCPLAPACKLVRCPACGYEIPAPTRLTRWLSRRLAKTGGAT
jgi:ribosomal protein S27E